MAYNPGQKMARMNVLKKMAGQSPSVPSDPAGYSSPSMKGPTVGLVQPVGPLQHLKQQEEKQMRVPGTSAKGMKESETKKIKNAASGKVPKLK